MNTVSVQTKRTLVRNLIEGVLNDHGVTFQIYERPVNQLLKVSSRLQDRIIGEASGSDLLRYCTIYWLGPDEERQLPNSSQESLLRLGGEQLGGVDMFRVTLDYEWDSGEEQPGASSFETWEDLLEGVNPKGLMHVIRETPALNIDSGPAKGDIVKLSVPMDTNFPGVPKPKQNLGIERTHYGEFTVAVTHY